MSTSGWLVIHSHVHVARTEQDFVLYNTLNGRTIRGPRTPEVRELVRRAAIETNQGVAELDDDDLEDEAIAEFTSAVRSAFAGDVVDAGRSSRRPFQIAPTVVVNHALEAARPGLREDASEVGRYLVELTLYVLGRARPLHPETNERYRQFLAPASTSGSDAALDPAAIATLLDQASSSPLSRINVLGDGLLDYPRLGELVTALRGHSARKRYFFDARNLAAIDDLEQRWSALGQGAARPSRRLQILGSTPAPARGEAGQIVIVVDPSVELQALQRTTAATATLGTTAHYSFVVASTQDYERTEAICAALGLRSVSVRPCFDGTNLEFFRDNVFVDEGDVLGQRLSHKEILRRGSINPGRFGRLTILPDGRVMASVQHEPLGRLGEDSLGSMVTRELRSGSSWLSSRASVEPCRSCVFSSLCPPITDQADSLGRFDTCTIREEGSDAR